MKQLPVIGSRSGKYNTNVIKSCLVIFFVDKADGLSVIEEEEQTEAKDVKKQQAFIYVVKCNNNFMCISIKKLKFLNIVNYITTGFTYSKYFSAYKITGEKEVFFMITQITS